jgi:hypothetical protein
MSSDRIEITEHITFLPGGGSHHVWKFADGSIWREEHFAVSPVLFHKRGDNWGLETAGDQGITSVSRKTSVHSDLVQPQ